VEVASPAEPAFDLVEHSASVTAPQALLVTQATTAAEPLNEGSTIPIDVPADSLPQLPLAKDSASDGADIHGATDSHTVLLKLPSHRGGSSRREKFKVLIEVFAMLFVVGGLTVIHYTSDHILAASAAKVVRGRESRANPDGPDKPPIEPARDGTTEIPRIPMVLSGDAHIPPNPATKPLFKHFISDTFGRLNGHPYSRAAESKITDEPLLSVNTDAGTAAANYLSGVVPTVGPTPPSPQNALADNASIKSAHILSIVEPQYSKLAVQTGNRGNVIINITISAQGTVTAATVVSGPTLLREEALTAVRLWKYQPAELHGRPIESQTKVAIRFE
jgi:protein TonB